MKGEITEQERERLMAEANKRDELNRRHDWWMRATRPRRKLWLRALIRRALHEAA